MSADTFQTLVSAYKQDDISLVQLVDAIRDAPHFADLLFDMLAIDVPGRRAIFHMTLEQLKEEVEQGCKEKVKEEEMVDAGDMELLINIQRDILHEIDTSSSTDVVSAVAYLCEHTDKAVKKRRSRLLFPEESIREAAEKEQTRTLQLMYRCHAVPRRVHWQLVEDFKNRRVVFDCLCYEGPSARNMWWPAPPMSWTTLKEYYDWETGLLTSGCELYSRIRLGDHEGAYKYYCKHGRNLAELVDTLALVTKHETLCRDTVFAAVYCRKEDVSALSSRSDFLLHLRVCKTAYCGAFSQHPTASLYEREIIHIITSDAYLRKAIEFCVPMWLEFIFDKRMKVAIGAGVEQVKSQAVDVIHQLRRVRGTKACLRAVAVGVGSLDPHAVFCAGEPMTNREMRPLARALHPAFVDYDRRGLPEAVLAELDRPVDKSPTFTFFW